MGYLGRTPENQLEALFMSGWSISVPRKETLQPSTVYMSTHFLHIHIMLHIPDLIASHGNCEAKGSNIVCVREKSFVYFFHIIHNLFIFNPNPGLLWLYVPLSFGSLSELGVAIYQDSHFTC